MIYTINGKTVYTLEETSIRTGYKVRTIQEYARKYKLGFRFRGNRWYENSDISFLENLRKGAKCTEKHG